jgi:predicted Zn-dependent protease
MRIFGAILGLMAAMSAVRADDIVSVLERSQRLRLEQRVVAVPDSERTQRVRASLDRLLTHGKIAPQSVELRVMQGGVQAEAMLGRLLVVGEAVGDLPESERLMLLAHELSHLTLGHWQALCTLYLKHIPGEVRPDTTDPVAGALGRDGHELSHQQEYEADAHGFALAHQLGTSLDDALSLLMRQPMMHDSATHPATRRRIAQFRMLQARADELKGQGGPLHSAQVHAPRQH